MVEMKGARSAAGRHPFKRYWRFVRILSLQDPIGYPTCEPPRGKKI